MTDELCIQNPGCQVTNESLDGKMNIAVCLGGTGIKGCNGGRDCMQAYYERMHDLGMHVEYIGVDVKTGLVIMSTLSPLAESSGQLIVTPHTGPDLVV